MKKECIKCKYYKNYYKSTECYCEKGYCVMDNSFLDIVDILHLCSFGNLHTVGYILMQALAEYLCVFLLM